MLASELCDRPTPTGNSVLQVAIPKRAPGSRCSSGTEIVVGQNGSRVGQQTGVSAVCLGVFIPRPAKEGISFRPRSHCNKVQ